MALKIVWTKRALAGYDKIISYLEEHWTDKEVKAFILESFGFLEILSNHPEILQKTATKHNIHRGPMNKYTLLTYRIKPHKGQIELINIRSARKKPLKP